MNPLVRKQLQQINLAIHDIRDAAAEARHQTDEQTQHRDKLLQDTWRQSKELATLRRNADLADHLQEQHQQDLKRLHDARHALENLLHAIKALKAEFRP